MQARIRRVLITASCVCVLTGCSGSDERLYGPPYYESSEWYYADYGYYYSGDDISLPDRRARADSPLKPEHPIALPPKDGPPSASQLPSGIDRPSTLPAPSTPRATPSFSGARPSIPSTPRAAPRGGGGGGKGGGGGGRRR